MADSEKETIDEEVEYKPISLFMKGLSYVVAGILLMLLLNTFLPTISEYITIFLIKVKLIDDEDVVTKWELYSFIGMIYLSWRIIKFLSHLWRSNEKVEIGTAVTGIPNPFYDPTYEKNKTDLQNKYNKLVTDYTNKVELLKESDQVQQGLQDSINKLDVRLRILMRHINNGNRVIRSLNYAFYKRGTYTTAECLKLVLEECITVLEKDQSDKSITLFKVVDDELTVASSVRINFESVDKRKFKKGEGFAGDVWEKNAPEIVNNISEADARFAGGGLPVTKIGSILGYPLTVEDEILGIFCLQSEVEEGFIEADLLTVEFYARVCTLILLYDKINKNLKQG